MELVDLDVLVTIIEIWKEVRKLLGGAKVGADHKFRRECMIRWGVETEDARHCIHQHLLPIQ